jgi:hypothetical protein
MALSGKHTIVWSFKADRRHLPQFEYAEVKVSDEVMEEGNTLWITVCNLLGEVGWDFTNRRPNFTSAWTSFSLKRIKPDPCPFCHGPIERCKTLTIRKSMDEAEKPPQHNACRPRALWAVVVDGVIEVHEEQCADCKCRLVLDTGREADYVAYDDESLICIDCEMRRKGCHKTLKTPLLPSMEDTVKAPAPKPPCERCGGSGEVPNMATPGVTRCGCGA